MEKLLLTLAMFIAVAANAQTSYRGFIDLTNASNGARIPTVINVGTYSVEVNVRAVTADSTGDILLSQSHYRDDNEMICEVVGNFKVGEVDFKMKALVGSWETQVKNNIYVNFNSREDTSFCGINANIFEGNSEHHIFVPRVSVELPVKDSRFSSVKLSVRPFIDGVKAQYNVGAGKTNNSLSVLNPGIPFKLSLLHSEDHRMGHELSFTANGYFHFDTVFSTLKRVK